MVLVLQTCQLVPQHCNVFKLRMANKQVSMNWIGMLASKLVELSFRPEPKLWTQKSMLKPLRQVTSVSRYPPMSRNSYWIGGSKGRGNPSEDDIYWNDTLNASPRNCASSRTTGNVMSALIFGRNPCLIMQPFASSYISRTNFTISPRGWCRTLRTWRKSSWKRSLSDKCGNACNKGHLAIVNFSLPPRTFK